MSSHDNRQIPEDVLREIEAEDRATAARTWELLEEKTPTLDTKAGWDRLQAAIDDPAVDAPSERGPSKGASPLMIPSARSSSLRRPIRSSRPPFRRAWSIAAALIVLVGIGWVFRGSTVAVSPAAGIVQVLTLPDGSTVTLNSGSRLSYRERASDALFTSWKRDLHLEGEALFSVTKTGSPFVVQGPRARVEVLGTQFNMHDRPGSDRTRVTLVEGVVRVYSSENIFEVLDEPGAAAEVSRSGLIRTKTDPARASVWIDGGFHMVDASLHDLFTELQARFGRRIAVDAGIDTQRPINVFYLEDVTVEQILQDVCLVQGCAFASYPDRIRISEGSDAQ